MLRTLMVAALVAGLLGCADDPGVERVDLNSSPEKLVLAALSSVKASKEQRIAVLSAYDSRNGQLRSLQRSSEHIIAQWYQLNRKAPEYLSQVDALSQEWSQVNGEEMKVRGAYEHELAAALSPLQWNEWQDFINSVTSAQHRAERNEHGLYGPGSRY
jgi:hypothetical protein